MSALERLSRSADLRHAILVTCVARLVMFAAGYAAVLTVGFNGAGELPPSASSNRFIDLPARWDANWYVGLAHGGYQWRGPDAQFQNVAFFPAYPFLIWLAATAMHVAPTSAAWTWVGVFVSNIAFALGLVYYQRLAWRVIGVEARFATWLLALYPFAIFFGLTYTESLFLLGVVAAWRHMEHGDPVKSAVWGTLAGFTRPNGFLLSLPLAMVAIRRADGNRRPLVLASLAPAGAMLAYSLYVYQLTGHPFGWAIAQEGWGRAIHNPVSTALELFGALQAKGVSGFWSERPYDVANGAALMFAVALAWPVGHRIGAPYTVFMLLNVLLPFAGGGLPSMGRYTSVLFPMFLWIAAWRRRWAKRACILVFAPLYCLLAALFFTWRSIF